MTTRLPAHNGHERRPTKANRAPLRLLLVGEIALTVALVTAPKLLAVAALLLAFRYAHRWGSLEALLLILTQVGLTASYASQREIALFEAAGLSFTPVDFLALAAVVVGILKVPALLRLPASFPHRVVARLLALVLYMLLPALVTYLFYPDTFSLAVRNLRSFVYLLAIPAYVFAAERREAVPSHLLIATNLSAIGASVTEMGQASGAFRVIGFEDVELLLRPTELVRLSILPEALVPALVACSLGSALLLSGAVQRSGVFALPFLATTLLISPGRSAIFASVLVATLLLFLFCVTAFPRPADDRQLIRGPKRTLTLLVMVALLSSAVLAMTKVLASADQDLSVVRDRFAEGVAPWSSESLVGRTSGWRAGFEMASRSPIYGTGLGTRFPELMAKHRLDSDFNFPGAPPNLLAKTGLLGLALYAYLLALPIGYSVACWRVRLRTTALVTGPILAALILRSLADDVTQGFQFPIILAVAFAACVTSPRRHRPPSSSSERVSTSAAR